MNEITRREVLTGAAAAALLAPSARADAPVQEIASGTVYEDGPERGGISGVLVSNGKDVVQTDTAGRWALPVVNGDVIFVIKPAGWATQIDPVTRLPRFFYIHQPLGTPAELGLRYRGVASTGDLPESIDFPLRRQREDPRFDVLLLTDPQPESIAELGYVRDDVIAQLLETDAAFGITLGDIMFDDLSMYDRSNLIVGTIGRTWHNCCGNHDMNFEAPDDTFSRETFKRHFGPRYAAFQYANTTFFTLDNVEYLGNKKYRGFFGSRQLEFIRNVLAHVPNEQLVVFCMHIPLHTAVGSEPNIATVNAQDFLQLISGRPRTISFSGHTHTNEHHFLGPEQGFSGDKPHQHHVLTAVSGSWWSGPYDVRGIPVALAGDGAPNGFHVLSIDGDRVTKRLVPAHEPASAAMRIMLDSEFHQASEETYRDFRMGQLLRGPLPAEAVSSAFLLVNFFDGGPNSLVSFKIGDQAPQPMQRVQRPDPFVQEVYARNVSTKKPWVQPVPSTHLWQAQLPADLAPGMHRLTVRGTDAFGAEHAASMVLEIL